MVQDGFRAVFSFCTDEASLMHPVGLLLFCAVGDGIESRSAAFPKTCTNLELLPERSSVLAH